MHSYYPSALVLTVLAVNSAHGWFYLREIINNTPYMVKFQTEHNGDREGIYITKMYTRGDSGDNHKTWKQTEWPCKIGNRNSRIGIGCSPYFIGSYMKIELDNAVVPALNSGPRMLIRFYDKGLKKEELKEARLVEFKSNEQETLYWLSLTEKDWMNISADRNTGSISRFDVNNTGQIRIIFNEEGITVEAVK